jgi:hypothetical protein
MIETIVPLPFADSISVCPPSSFALSLIPLNPKPIFARFPFTASGSKPSPSSLIMILISRRQNDLGPMCDC